jgi:uncharacterized protein DUF932
MRAFFGERLDDQQILRHAPSVFAPLKHPDRSSQYRHIPTCEVLSKLRENGFYPVAASQSGEPESLRGLFSRHCLRFRREGFDTPKTGDILPEVVLLNSHDGSGGYDISCGLFRIVCLNGLVAGAGDTFRIKIRHTGEDMVGRVLAASEQVITMIPTLLTRVQALQEKQLDESRRLDFARAALKVSGSRLLITADTLLSPRRPDDLPEDAWTVLNVVQENIVRGGVIGHDRRGSERRTGPISEVNRGLHVNRALWDLAEAA